MSESPDQPEDQNPPVLRVVTPRRMDQITPPKELVFNRRDGEEASQLTRGLGSISQKTSQRQILIKETRRIIRNWVAAIQNYTLHPKGVARQVEEGGVTPLEKFDPTEQVKSAQLELPCDSYYKRAEAFVTRMKEKLRAFQEWEQTEDGQIWLQVTSTRDDALDAMEA